MGDIGDLEKNAAIFIDWCDRMLSDEQESKNEHSYPSSQLPVYLSSIAKMMKYIVTMDDSIIESLQKLIGTGSLVVHLPNNLSRTQSFQAVSSSQCLRCEASPVARPSKQFWNWRTF